MGNSVSPAYGRDYSTVQQARKDWYDGMDFIYHNCTSKYDGKLCSCNDFTMHESIELRYSKMRRLTIVKGTRDR